jgi:hypothetical protein
MTPERIAESNQLLRHPPVVGLALSRALGLHVVGALAKRHEIAVELRKGAPVGTVALVALPKAILEARGAGATAGAPAYAPDVDDRGDPTPLGARRAPAPAAADVTAATAAAVTEPPVTWHPPDEPPVEQWRREGLAREQAAPPVAPAVEDPVVAPAVEDPAVEDPVVEPRTLDEEISDGVADSPPLTDVPVDDALDQDELPLPTRVPGHHMTHQPTPAGSDPIDDSDPLRPYRVHELLTRHTQGKMRGQAHHDAPDTDMPHPATSTTAAPDHPGVPGGPESVPDPEEHR